MSARRCYAIEEASHADYARLLDFASYGFMSSPAGREPEDAWGHKTPHSPRCRKMGVTGRMDATVGVDCRRYARDSDDARLRHFVDDFSPRSRSFLAF